MSKSIDLSELYKPHPRQVLNLTGTPSMWYN
jgi:hypothetical protein